MKGQSRTFLVLALVELAIAVLRYWMKGWMEALGVPAVLGSLLSSITIVLLISLVVLFAREGRASGGRYLRAAGWYVALAAWSQILVIAGILITARTGTPTYYEEMMGAHLSMPPARHALSHAVAFFPIAGVGLLLGAGVYWVARRGRVNPTPGSPIRIGASS